jgi:hypothetical protein
MAEEDEPADLEYRYYNYPKYIPPPSTRIVPLPISPNGTIIEEIKVPTGSSSEPNSPRNENDQHLEQSEAALTAAAKLAEEIKAKREADGTSPEDMTLGLIPLDQRRLAYLLFLPQPPRRLPGGGLALAGTGPVANTDGTDSPENTPRRHKRGAHTTDNLPYGNMSVGGMLLAGGGGYGSTTGAVPSELWTVNCIRAIISDRMLTESLANVQDKDVVPFPEFVFAWFNTQSSDNALIHPRAALQRHNRGQSMMDLRATSSHGNRRKALEAPGANSGSSSGGSGIDSKRAGIGSAGKHAPKSSGTGGDNAWRPSGLGSDPNEDKSPSAIAVAKRLEFFRGLVVYSRPDSG